MRFSGRGIEFHLKRSEKGDMLFCCRHFASLKLHQEMAEQVWSTVFSHATVIRRCYDVEAFVAINTGRATVPLNESGSFFPKITAP
jgi:hypothetical protein